MSPAQPRDPPRLPPKVHDDTFVEPDVPQHPVAALAMDEAPTDAWCEGIRSPTYLSYDPVTQTRFLLHEHPIDWLSVLEDYIDDLSVEEEDPFEDVSDAKETLEIEEDPFKNYS